MTIDPFGTGKTVFRAGGAMMYDTPSLYTSQRVSSNPPYVNEIDLNGTDEAYKQEAEMLARSPITRLDAISRPLLVIQGANDARVVQAESDNIVNALAKSTFATTAALKNFATKGEFGVSGVDGRTRLPAAAAAQKQAQETLKTYANAVKAMKKRLRQPARSANAPSTGPVSTTSSSEAEIARPHHRSPRPCAFPTMCVA